MWEVNKNKKNTFVEFKGLPYISLIKILKYGAKSREGKKKK